MAGDHVNIRSIIYSEQSIFQIYKSDFFLSSHSLFIYLFVKSNVQYIKFNIKSDFVILILIVYQNWFTQCSIRVQVYDQNALLMQSFPEKNDKANTNKRGFMCHVLKS